MSNIKDIKGNFFGRLEVIEMMDKRLNGYVAWKCRCICGKIVTVQSGHLQSGHTQSCGCYKSDRIRETKTTISYYHPRLNRIWQKMKHRCCGKSSHKNKDYGGRGIKVCEEWMKSFENFCVWATSNGYEEGLSIERVNVNGDYEPRNCKWIPLNQQQRNRRNCVYIEDYDGQKLILEDFSKKYSLGRATVKYRYVQGDRGERLVRPPQNNKLKYKNSW